MYDYRRTAANHGREGRRLRALADELNRIEERLRAIAGEIGFQQPYAKRLPREFRGIYDVKRALREIETAAVKTGTACGIVRGGADVIEPYDDPQ